MIVDGRAYTDNTIHKAFASCALQGTLRHVLHWNTKEDSAHLRAGQAVHEALAELYRITADGITPDTARGVALSQFALEYEEYSTANIPREVSRLHHENVATILDEWILSRFERTPWVVTDPRLVEVGFAFPLDDTGTRIAFGRFDAIGRSRSDGSWAVVDHKTTGRLDATWTEAWTLDPQLTHYYWAALQHVPDLAGFYVNGIQLNQLPRTDRFKLDGTEYQCKDHSLPYSQCYRHAPHTKFEFVGPITRTPEAIEHWRADAIRLNDKYRYYAEAYDPKVVGTTPDLSQVEMEGPFTGACRFCSFRDFCRLGQKPSMLPALYQQDEWMPYDPRDYEGVTAADLLVEA